MEEREHLAELLKEVLDSLKREDYSQLRDLSNQLVHDSSINQDPDIISVAVIIYSLSKIIERENYQSDKGWPDFYKSYVKGITHSIKQLEKNDIERFREDIAGIRETLKKLSGNLKEYINDVFRKASINKASKIYEHGISMGKTAQILGISIWELAEYSGQSHSTDINLGITLPIKDRIKLAERFFEK